MSQASSDLADGVPFSFFCSLLREISRLQPQKARSSHGWSNQSYPARDVFGRWVTQLRKVYSPLPTGTTAIVFKLLFPEEDISRKYNMQETKLSHRLAECFGMDPQKLRKWLSESCSGCLGEELRLALENACPTVDGHISPLSIEQVDTLLDELASLSGYSHVSVRKKYPHGTRRRRLSILKDLFCTLSPIDASFLTQIILKDLQPILYPLQEMHYTASLIDFNSASVKMLTIYHAMELWDPSGWMRNAYLVKSTIAEVANEFELPPAERSRNVPRIGTPVTMPKSEKGRDPRHALGFFHRSQKVWAETKYDGERAQIHVEVSANNAAKITIFSKSKRDSTLDRKGIHDVIYRALGLSKYGIPGEGRSEVKSSVILDAEMVPFDGENIDEFWRIRGLVGETAYGIRSTHNAHVQAESQSSLESCSQASMMTTHSETRRLGLVFFDILALNSSSLLHVPYSQRRELLESLITATPGECMLSQRVSIHMDDDENAQSTLEKIFADIIATHEEGIVLKADEARYNDFRMPWVKLKKDYIPGYGDSLDLVVVGAGWEKARARKLRVKPNTLTTLYIGGLANAQEIRRQPSRRPHFEVYFTVSYGLSRQQLEEVNFLIKNSESVPYHASSRPRTLPYTFTLLPGLEPPRLLLHTPLLAELFGAGFTKAHQSQNYELRFPRVTKIHRASERSWRDGVDLQELHRIACDVIGRDSSRKEAKDICSGLWGKVASPGAKSLLKRKATAEVWEERFATMDGRSWTRENSSVEEDIRTPSPKRVRTKIDHLRTPPVTGSQVKPATRPLGPRTNAMSGVSTPTVAVDEDQSLVLQITSPVVSQKPDKSRMPLRASPPMPTLAYDVFMPQAKSCEETLRSVESVPASGSKFLENALVWFAKPRGKSTGSKISVPRTQRLHSLESLLLGCGWSMTLGEAIWAERGIIFVDDSCEAGTRWKEHVLKTIQKRRDSLPGGQARKPIWIFDTTSWSCENEVESRALHRLN
ncbi:DNA ligase [Hypsizygus marmoreus]|uniref:DNA ligase n=1 Tax=Hypsizygus marmoreus TaxID=39966 RepID=A0A369JFG3_HYPMA|nr:DNA ligase [Hypsizygus marmoreus]